MYMFGRTNERWPYPNKQTNPKDRPKLKPMTIPKGRAKQQVLVTQSSGGLLDVPHDKASCYCHKTIATSLRDRDSPPQSKRTRRAPRGEHAPLEASETNNAASLRATIQVASPRCIKTHAPTTPQRPCAPALRTQMLLFFTIMRAQAPAPHKLQMRAGSGYAPDSSTLMQDVLDFPACSYFPATHRHMYGLSLSAIHWSFLKSLRDELLAVLEFNLQRSFKVLSAGGSCGVLLNMQKS